MRTNFADILDRLRTSLWFIPAMMAGAAVILAFVLVRAHDWLAVDWMYRAPWLVTGDPEGARQILATIAGSIITVTGVIFSVTLVAISLASQQFGPRLLRTFMRDRGNQFVLGTFIGTFLYSMLVLRTVQESNGEFQVPYLAVTFAVGLAMLALGVLIYFIHHVVASIQADAIILSVSQELHGTMDSLFPETHEQHDSDEHGASDVNDKANTDGWNVDSAKAGYVRALDAHGLVEIAESHDVVIHIVARPGRFVVDGMVIAHVFDSDSCEAAEREVIAHKVRNGVLIGPARTAEQDIEFSVAQLVEIATRSLSPSLNDPFTAMTCLDRLGEALGRLGRRKLPKKQRRYSGGKLRLLVDRPNFAGLVDLSFDQIRQNSREKPAVAIRMLEVIRMIMDCLKHRPECFKPLLKQARMIVNGAEQAIAEQNDRAAITERFADVLARIERNRGAG